MFSLQSVPLISLDMALISSAMTTTEECLKQTTSFKKPN